MTKDSFILFCYYTLRLFLCCVLRSGFSQILGCAFGKVCSWLDFDKQDSIHFAVILANVGDNLYNMP